MANERFELRRESRPNNSGPKLQQGRAFGDATENRGRKSDKPNDGERAVSCSCNEHVRGDASDLNIAATDDEVQTKTSWNQDLAPYSDDAKHYVARKHAPATLRGNQGSPRRRRGWLDSIACDESSDDGDEMHSVKNHMSSEGSSNGSYGKDVREDASPDPDHPNEARFRTDWNQDLAPTISRGTQGSLTRRRQGSNPTAYATSSNKGVEMQSSNDRMSSGESNTDASSDSDLDSGDQWYQIIARR